MAVWKNKNIYSKVAIELGVDKYTTFPLTAKQVIIWDEGKMNQVL